MRARLRSGVKYSVNCLPVTEMAMQRNRFRRFKGRPLSSYPLLVAEFDQRKNGDIDPAYISAGSGRRVWWRCSKKAAHQWQAAVCNRVHGTRCPFCAGQKVLQSESLAATNPKIASQWDQRRNGKLRPEQVGPGSGRRVWWSCSKGSDHRWQTTIASRVKGGHGCPFCAGQRATQVRNLRTSHPHLAKQWHKSLNGIITPEDVLPGSGKRVFWQCPVGPEHIWSAKVADRAGGTGCPFCNGKKVCGDNCLEAISPSIARQWHPTRNGRLTPRHVTDQANRVVWWRCEQYPHHEWRVDVASRRRRPNCPFCSNKKLSNENSLAVMFPAIASQWHATRNGDMTPTDVVFGSGKRVWWQCPRFTEHVWRASVVQRTSKSTSCPACTNQSSRPEIRILCELRQLFSSVDSRARLGGLEADIVLPRLRVVVEYDGVRFHSTQAKVLKDRAKTEVFERLGYTMIRVRERPLRRLRRHDVLVPKRHFTKKEMNLLIAAICSVSHRVPRVRLDQYVAKEAFVANDLYRQYVTAFPGPLRRDSLAVLHPEVCKDWDHEKNAPLLPEFFTPGSGQRVWWKCHRHSEHSWEGNIADRVGRRCPYCVNQRVSQTNSLATRFPEVAAEWDHERNGELTPESVVARSSRMAYWRCPKGADHRWRASVGNRTSATRTSCPFCAGKRPSKTYNLAVCYPKVAAEWHLTRNRKVSPQDIVPGSSHKYWWHCKLNPSHCWRATVGNRTRGTGCPHCRYGH